MKNVKTKIEGESIIIDDQNMDSKFLMCSLPKKLPDFIKKSPELRAENFNEFLQNKSHSFVLASGSFLFPGTNIMEKAQQVKVVQHNLNSLLEENWKEKQHP